jgi:hypothetical protein
MDGSNENEMYCCFCGKLLTYKRAINIVISSKEMNDENQKIFSHKKCLSLNLHKSIPLHPDLIEDDE